MRRVAGVDVGSNSFLLTVLERGSGSERVVLDRTDLVRLGEGVDRTHELSAAAMDRAVAKLVDYRAACDRLGVAAVRAAGTAALRDATNRQALLDRVARETGWPIEVISGEREAELTYADVAVTHGQPGEALALLDIGGGSSEIVLGCDGRVASRRSYNIGSRRLAERARPADPLTAACLARCRAIAAEAAADLGPTAARLVGTGGTITTLAAVHLGLAEYDAAAVSRTVLDLATIEHLLEDLAALPLARRREVVGLEPGRADIIVTGAVLLGQLLRRLGADRVAVSAGGLRFALAREADSGGDAAS